jgi:hypothetical protein
MTSRAACNDATSTITRPRVAFCVAGAARTFPTPLVLTSMRSNLIDAMAGAGSTSHRVFLHLKLGDLPKLDASNAGLHYTMPLSDEDAARRRAMLNAVFAALETPWVRRVLGEAVVINGSGHSSSVGWRPHSPSGGGGGGGGVASALRPSNDDAWLSYTSWCCPPPFGSNQSGASSQTASDNGEQRVVLQTLALRWCADAMERFERADEEQGHGGAGATRRFELVAYARPDLYLHAPVHPWCAWTEQTAFWSCSDFRKAPGSTQLPGSHSDALWASRRGPFALFARQATLHRDCSCSSVMAEQQRAGNRHKMPQCCGGGEALIRYAQEAYAKLPTAAPEQTLERADEMGCATQGVLAGTLLRNVQRKVALDSCGPTCRNAQRHICDVIFTLDRSNQPLYVTSFKWRISMLSVLQLPPKSGLMLFTLFQSSTRGLNRTSSSELSPKPVTLNVTRESMDAANAACKEATALLTAPMADA